MDLVGEGVGVKEEEGVGEAVEWGEGVLEEEEPKKPSSNKILIFYYIIFLLKSFLSPIVLWSAKHYFTIWSLHFS